MIPIHIGHKGVAYMDFKIYFCWVLFFDLIVLLVLVHFLPRVVVQLTLITF
jgi:hypothetical protein